MDSCSFREPKLDYCNKVAYTETKAHHDLLLCEIKPSSQKRFWLGYLYEHVRLASRAPTLDQPNTVSLKIEENVIPLSIWNWKNLEAL
jgi:hypothetical protein